MGNKEKNLDSLAKCSVCGNNLEASNILILEEKDQKTTFHATCEKCASATVVFLSSNVSGLVSVGMATDLDAAEVKKVFGSMAISADEVIDVHQLVSGNADILQLVKSIGN